MKDIKEVCKLTVSELQEASCRWFLSLGAQYLPSHLTYIAAKAKHEVFNDTAHVMYDTAIRKLAEHEGFVAFTAGDAAASLIHYGHESMQAKAKSTVTGAVKGHTTFERGGKRVCFPWNKDSECDRDGTCEFGHWCSKCGSRGHKCTKCTKD